jgi:hypothetical protein
MLQFSKEALDEAVATLRSVEFARDAAIASQSAVTAARRNDAVLCAELQASNASLLRHIREKEQEV